MKILIFTIFLIFTLFVPYSAFAQEVITDKMNFTSVLLNCYENGTPKGATGIFPAGDTFMPPDISFSLYADVIKIDKPWSIKLTVSPTPIAYQNSLIYEISLQQDGQIILDKIVALNNTRSITLTTPNLKSSDLITMTIKDPHTGVIPSGYSCLSLDVYFPSKPNMITLGNYSQPFTTPEFPFVVPILLIGVISVIVFYRLKFN